MKKENFKDVCDFVRFKMFGNFNTLTPKEWDALPDIEKREYVECVFDFHYDVCQYLVSQLEGDRIIETYNQLEEINRNKEVQK